MPTDGLAQFWLGEWPWPEVGIGRKGVGRENQGKESPAGPQRPCARLDVTVAQLLGQAMKDQPVDDGIKVVFVPGRFREVGDAKLNFLASTCRCAPGLCDRAAGKVEADGVISFLGKRQCRDSNPAARVENRTSETPLTLQGGEFRLQFTDIPAGISGRVRRHAIV